jgi:tRNA-splicing endonuclease subunit Sen34
MSSSFDESFDSIAEPIPISLVAGRYLLFDVNVVTYLRSAYHICGVLTGTIPQIPQQNVFLGLPLELMPEEARLLVEKEVAYIVDDAAWHKERFSTFEGSEKRQYLDSLRAAGLTAKKNAENALAKQAAKRRTRSSTENTSEDSIPPCDNSALDSEDILFSDDSPSSSRPDSPVSIRALASNAPWRVTPTISYHPSSLPQNTTQQPYPPVPSSYPLYAHLHSRDYFLWPGLRFGCDYNVYPGDPLRFHSHFSAVSYEWNEEISMVNLVGGGRLGTRVKKAFLIGGKDTATESQEGDGVRTFCIEWGGM